MALPSIYFGRVNSKSKGVIDAIEKQLKSINLKPANRLTFSYNPFAQNVTSLRGVSQFLYKDQVRETNLKCLYKTTVHNSSEEPKLEVKLESGKKIVFKTCNLTTVEILEKFNELISSQFQEK